jgi:hypothetical protein
LLSRERGNFAEKKREAAAGIEPAHKGFADLRLTTWLRRLNIEDLGHHFPLPQLHCFIDRHGAIQNACDEFLIEGVIKIKRSVILYKSGSIMG